MKAKRVTQVSIEVASAERGVSAIRQSESGLWKPPSKRPEYTSLPDAGLTEKHHALAIAEGFLDFGDERRLALGEPEVGVVDLLREWRRAEREGREHIRRCRHRRPPPPAACARVEVHRAFGSLRCGTARRARLFRVADGIHEMKRDLLVVELDDRTLAIEEDSSRS